MKSAYINKNTSELINWLRSVGLFPIDYPECDRYNGLIAPYHIRKGMPNEDKDWVIFYKDGVVYDTDDEHQTIISAIQKKSLRKKYWN